MSLKFSRDMTFYQAIQLSPKVAEVLAKHNLGCLGCMSAMNETLEHGAMAHGLDVEELLKDLNAIFSE